MYRLMLVDDEPIAADSLADFIEKQENLELEVVKAYSGQDAMRLMADARFDILLTDYRMPDITGLDLVQAMYEKWPHCRLIIITGHNNFEYIYQTNKYQAVYLLKTESDSTILAEILKAVDSLRQTWEAEVSMERSLQQHAASLGYMQNEYLRSFVQGNLQTSTADLQELELSVRDHKATFLFTGFLRGGSASVLEQRRLQARLIQACQRFFPKYAVAHTILDERTVLWLLQTDEAGGTEQNKNSILYLKGMLELIQQDMEAAGVSVAFLLAAQPSAWRGIPLVASSLVFLVRIRDDQYAPVEMVDAKATILQKDTEEIYGKLALLKTYTSTFSIASRGAILELCGTLLDAAVRLEADRKGFSGEIVRSVQVFYSSLVGQAALWTDSDPTQTATAFSDTANLTATQARRVLLERLKGLFESIGSAQQRDADDVVSRVKDYIHSHLGEDLSLVRLASLTNYNPTYLSRLFKHRFGITLSDYILDCRFSAACEKLKNSAAPVNGIAFETGFNSAPYFTKMFKRKFGVTPQQYRHRYLPLTTGGEG